MDSVTQFVLGSGVAALTIGPVVGARKAVLIGGVIGTLPDLDVLISHADPIDSFVGHRGPTHAFPVHTLAAPLIGEVLMLLDRRLRDHRARTWLAVWLVLVTHAMIDAMTTYGTRLFWPFSDDPVGVASIFIIDPLYTLPLLIAALCGLFSGRWSGFMPRLFTVSVVASTLYMGWTAVAQQIMAAEARRSFDTAGETVLRSETQPLPFNTLAWRTIAINDRGEVLTLYASMLDPEPETDIQRMSQGLQLIDRIPDRSPVDKVAAFSKGFYYLSEAEGSIRVSDLRMGMHPDYVFTFEVARRSGPSVLEGQVRRITVNRRLEDVGWVFRRIIDPDAAPPQ